MDKDLMQETPQKRADAIEGKSGAHGSELKTTIKTWNKDWEYPLARGIQKIINLFKKSPSPNPLPSEGEDKGEGAKRRK